MWRFATENGRHFALWRPILVEIRNPLLDNPDAEYASLAATQDRLFQFRYDRFPEDGGIGFLLPAERAVALG
jgi:hypothetical protein